MDIVNRSTAIGAFASRADAEQAVSALRGAGFGADQVGIVLPDGADTALGSEQAGTTALLAGAMFRSLIGVEIPSEEVRYYEEALEEGRPLVMVRSEGRFPEAIDILYRYGGKYMAPF
jgi:hypothetical protein